MTRHLPDDDLTVGDRYYILASSVAADLPKLVLKHDNGFLVADRRGDFPRLPGSEFGFYVEDTRFLQQFDLRVHEQRPLLLNAAVSEEALQLAVDLTNPDVSENGHLVLQGRTIRLARRLTLHGRQLYQTLTLENFSGDSQELTLSWHFGADFADVFEVRGLVRDRRGIVLPPEYDRSTVRFAYQGLDEVLRTTYLAFDPEPAELGGGVARYRLSMPSGGTVELSVTISAVRGPQARPPSLHLGEVLTQRRTDHDEVARRATQIQTDHEQVNHWITRARTDLRMLLTRTPHGFIPYAGIPWYVAPFGRDSLITALQVLPFAPEIARGTLRFLASFQGTRDDDFTDQEPGKILHEYRRGELAACREIVFIPYYGSVDATPLFVILLAEYFKWTGDVGLVRELWPALERALRWMAGPGAPDADGYLKYHRRSPRGLDNQGWKDAQDAVMHASGQLAAAPIALVEAQAYKYAALLGAAELAEGIGRAEVGPALREGARLLRQRFERDLWLEDEAFYALALDGEGQPCRVISSNPGHCLWMGIVTEARAEAVAKRLMSSDMFSGWGLRTLSARERLYNPMSYHNGSVWPHDTAIAAVGLRRYGLTDPFVTLASGLLEAVLQFEDLRMPELFCGFPRVPEYGPTRYPVACSPQAWTAGVVFQLLSAMLGLAPDARENR
ncbi:MAG TPA: amylo-alpha-1,6-glucosidase, partial [Methylomirabilota bacterium]|nr:amylo-alpha-1,6-glucosidase [Methylomirabilota bacterium]